MFKVVLVEEDSKNIRWIKKNIQDNFPGLTVEGEAKELTKAIDLILKIKPDLIIIDALVNNKSVFSILEEIKHLDFEIIFVTSHKKYSLEAIKYNAVDFLIKPLVKEDFCIALEKSIKKMTAKLINQELKLMISNIKNVQHNNVKLAIPTIKGFIFLFIDEIIRCEANGAYTIIYTTKKEKITASKSLKEYEESLPTNRFYRIHNSHLINIDKVTQYNKGRGGYVIMEDGMQIEVAIRRRNSFLSIFQ